jgi:glutathione S-transferase
MTILLSVEPQWVSPWVFACFVTLREKKLAFEVRELRTTNGDTKKADYLDQTITGRVPSLVHDGFALAESSAIIEYLEEAFPEIAVLPRTPRERARCRQLMSWLRSDETLPLRKERSTHTMFFESQRAKTPLSEEGRASATKLCEVTSRVLREASFERWNIVQSELAFILHRLILNGDPCPDDVRAWATEQWKRPTVREFVDRERPEG